MADELQQFLINSYMNKLHEEHNGKVKKLDDSYQISLLKLSKALESNIKLVNENIKNTLSSLEQWYMDYCKDETNNEVIIPGTYYNKFDPTYYNNMDYAKFVDRNIENWVKFNKCEKDTIDLFIRKLPINISINMKLSDFQRIPRNKKGYAITHKYVGGQNLIITANKL